MRPVNLIPPEDRRGEQAPLRTGALVYLVVGALVAVLVGVTAMVLLGNKVTERESEVTRLQRDDAALAARAQQLSSYTQFQEMSEQRVQTVAGLADSRFDWERVMRELALVLPSNVWLVSMNATVAPGVGLGEGGETSGLRATAPGPALELVGCAASQPDVAGFVTALKDVDATTRVGVESSELPNSDEGAAVNSGGEAESKANEDCRTRKFIAKFKIVVAFDAAPVPVVAGEAAAPEEAPPAEEAEGSEEETETAE
ncbi:MAG TPA: hypothetical protein VF030_11140 [Solirubrobacterales bacterium]